MTLEVHKILKEANEKPKLSDRMDYLRQFAQRPLLKELLRISYDKRVEVLLPDSDPPFTPSDMPDGMHYSRLDVELRRFRIFLKGSEYDNLPQTKRESLFLDILQSIDPGDARVLLDAFQKKLKIKGMTAKHINEVFGLNIPESTSKKKERKTEEVAS